MLLFSPMEQFTIFNIMTFNLSFNNINYLILLVTLLFILLSQSLSPKLISNNFSIFLESCYGSIRNMITNYIGIKSIYYLPLLFTLFHFILFSNLIGMIPYSQTITVEIVITLSLAFTILIGILIYGIFSHGNLLFAVFLPSGTPLGLIFLMIPLEILAYITRTLSLGLRLAVNLITGHILAKVIISFIWKGYINNVSILILAIPLFLVILFLALELLIAYLQAYIFTFITIITIRDINP
jgi:ATP synthase subunit 6